MTAKYSQAAKEYTEPRCHHSAAVWAKWLGDDNDDSPGCEIANAFTAGEQQARDRLQELERDVVRLTTERTEQLDANAQLEDAFGALQRDYRETLDTRDTLRKTVARLDNERIMLQARVDLAEEGMNSWRRVAEGNHETITQLQRDLKAAEAKVRDLETATSEPMRTDYPFVQFGTWVLGPELISSTRDPEWGTVLSWRGARFTASDAVEDSSTQRALREGASAQARVQFLEEEIRGAVAALGAAVGR